MTAPVRSKDLCLDARDHQALASWWCTALGYARRDDLQPADDGWTWPRDWPVPIADPSGAGPLICIVPVPEPKTVKTPMHLDVVGDTQALLAAGATLLRQRGGDIERGRARRPGRKRVLLLRATRGLSRAVDRWTGLQRGCTGGQAG